ncbi:GGDEF domain-containing protein [Actinoplanes rectilineatus]|uniref:GGDEF domain-containing protein n=1 Tax=Actinoplanes rectilineatus TaxID=113571 RepID=UPI000697AB03|nr:GGDEF domain-containing protein [Actinoplanes rectilineatus]
MRKTLVASIAAAALGAVFGRLGATPTIRVLHRENAALAEQVRSDRLTGVLSRAGLEQAYSATNDRERFVIVVDLDTFKSVNDEHGHPAGDQVLSALGARLNDLASRHHGWAGRLGGDEFAVILADCTAAEALQAATYAVAAIVTTSRTGSVQVRGSAGVAHAAATTPWSSALTDADIALYHAKQHGTVTLFKPGMTYPQRPAPRRRARDVRTTS